MHGLVIFVKEGLPFAWDLSLENSADSYLCFPLALLQCHTSFSSIDHLLRHYAWFLVLFHLTYIPSANVFVSEDFNIHHKDWLTYSGGTDRPGELCHNFSISNDVLRWLKFLLGSLTMTLTHSPALLGFFLSSGKSICSAMTFPPLGNSDHVIVSVSIDFPIH